MFEIYIFINIDCWYPATLVLQILIKITTNINSAIALGSG